MQILRSFAVLGLLALSACTVSLVDQDEIKPVKRIAFVSIYANPIMHSEDGPSTTEKVSSWANTLGIGGDKAKEIVKASPADFGVDTMLAAAFRDYKKALGGIRDWSVVDPASYTGKPFFQAFVAGEEKRWKDYYGQLAGIIPDPSRRYPGLSWSLDYDQKHAEALRKSLEDLARQLDVDALAVLSLDFSYAASTALNGTGTALLRVHNFLEVYNKHGLRAVHGSYIVKGDDTVPMVNNNIIFNDSSRKIMTAAIGASAAWYEDKIKSEL